MKEYRRIITLLLVVSLLAGFFPSAANAEGSVDEVLSHTEANAGGWGLGTPIILATTSISQQIMNLQQGEEFSATACFSFLGEKKFWCGLAVDLALTWTICHLTPMLPVGLFIRTLLNVSAGFIGWEIGTSNLENTDWLSIALQATAATAAMLVLPGSLGFLTTSILAVTAALASAALLKIVRNKCDECEGPSEDLSYQAADVRRDSIRENDRERRKAYLSFVKAAKAGSANVQEHLERYQMLSPAFAR
mgnify:CR=1 FL=1